MLDLEGLGHASLVTSTYHSESFHQHAWFLTEAESWVCELRKLETFADGRLMSEQVLATEPFCADLREDLVAVGNKVRRAGNRISLETVRYTLEGIGLLQAARLAGGTFYFVAPGELRFDDLDGDGFDEAYTIVHSCMGRGTPDAHTLHTLLYASFDRVTDALGPEQSRELEASPGCDDGYVSSDFAIADADGDGQSELITTVPADGRSPGAWAGSWQVPMKTVTYRLDGAPGRQGRWLQMDADGDRRREWARLSITAGTLRIDRMSGLAPGLYGSSPPAPVFLSLFGAPLPLAGFRVADIDGDGRDDLVQVIANGSALYFIALQPGADGQWSVTTRVASSSDARQASQARWHLMDTDGDGTWEWVFLASSPNGASAAACPFPQVTHLWVYRYPTDGGSDMGVTSVGGVETCDAYPQTAAWQAADLDGDGGDDLVGAWPIIDASAGPRTRVEALLSRRDGTFGAVASLVEGRPVSPQAWRVTDLNGDGARDLLAVAIEASTPAPQPAGAPPPTDRDRRPHRPQRRARRAAVGG